ncbi:hypothetical protein [Delftia acidovorans]|uniref:hypothetical protein n=1 Tax=Delftia acidovorans TaxID=80866 RepID=UPI003D0B2789
MTAITTAAHIDAQTQEELMRQAGIWIEHSTLIEDDLPARPLAAVQAEKHQLDRYTQLVADRAAARGSKCLAQIEEPAQPVAEICSASHDDAEFGERAIKPLCDISSFEYGTPLYAGAAPAAVAPQGVTAWMHPETRDVISDAKKHEMSTQYGTETRRKAEGYSVAMAPVEQSAAAPALEAPAAQASKPLAVTPEMRSAFRRTYREGGFWNDRLDYALDRMLAAAPQAPAAPADPMDWPLPCDVTVGHGTIRKGCKLRTLVLRMQVLYDLSQKVELAAPAAPAVDAWLQPDDMAALQRFHETAEDDESYDIGKEAVARLCAFGCLQSHSFGRYSTTDFGDYLLDTWAGARTLPFTTAAERAAQAAAKGAA